MKPSWVAAYMVSGFVGGLLGAAALLLLFGTTPPWVQWLVSCTSGGIFTLFARTLLLDWRQRRRADVVEIRFRKSE